LADLFLVEAGRPPQNSQFPIARQAVSLARAGLLDPHTALDLEGRQSQALYRRYRVAENLLLHARSENTRRLAELESARRVLENRTRSLFTLQDIGRALIRTHDRATLAQRIGRYALELCGAERFVLYLQEADGGLLILASQGWVRDLEGVRIPAGEADLHKPTTQPMPFDELPPGVPALSEEELDNEPKAGLRAALLAEGEQVGWMVLHSDRRGSFQPGEIALLQTFANQAALALQRAGLIDDLRLKIQKLEAAQESLAQKERLVHELELARQVQQAMLPGYFPQVPGLRFTARNRPARQVGGDFYDVFQIDEDQIGIAVADVSDKGMPAALYMALTRSLLRAEARRGDNPGHVLAELNSLLLEISRPDLFVTIFYAVLDLPTRTLTYARAGHERPALLRDGGVRLLGGEGIPLALFDGAEFSLIGESLRMLPGDRLVLYSDGLYDLLSPQEEHFGRARLIEWLRDHAGEKQETFCENLFAELGAHQGEAEQFDDITLVVMDVIS
jgi:sigma-B regulation protein RsbU (phosphoserine phosphatase)